MCADTLRRERRASTGAGEGTGLGTRVRRARDLDAFGGGCAVASCYGRRGKRESNKGGEGGKGREKPSRAFTKFHSAGEEG